MLKKFTRFFLFFILPILTIFIFVVSYFAMRKLVFPIDLKMKNGKLQSEIADQIRDNLLKCKNVKSVHFKSKDGLRLSGILIKKNNPKANILICHGYRSRKEFVVDVADMFDDCNVLLFDFRAHGQSSGKLRTLGCHEYKDVIAAAEFLNNNTKSNRLMPNKLPIVIFGFSMGGSTALRALQVESNICDALILDSSYSNLNNVIYTAFPLKSGGLPSIPFVPLLKTMVNVLASCKIQDMRPIDGLRKIDKPIFFIHSCIDKIVPPNDSLLMYAKCLSSRKKLWIGPSHGHGRLRKDYSDKYKNKVNKFVKKVLA